MKHIINTACLIAFMAFSLSCSQKTGEIENIEGVQTVSFQNFDLTWLSDNSRVFPLTTFPSADSADIAALGLQDGVPGSMSAALIRTKKHNLLFDTAMGGKIMEGLAFRGVSPEDVDYIFITHMHGDHIGGMLKDGQKVFPNAEVFVSRMEYEAWNTSSDGNRTTQAQEVFEAYKDQLNIFEFGDELPDGVKAINAVGHTPGHAAYQKGEALIVGDIMHGVALQIEHPEVNAGFDSNQEDAHNTRVTLLDYARTNKLVMVGMHFPDPGYIDFR